MSVGERILKIDQHLAKLEAKIWWHPFSGHGVYNCILTNAPVDSNYAGRV